MKNSQVNCSERNRLRAEYEAALGVLARAVDALPGHDPGDSGRLIAAAKSAKQEWESRGAKWQAHLREHSCDAGKRNDDLASTKRNLPEPLEAGDNSGLMTRS